MNAVPSETRFAVLIFTDIVGSTDLKARHGVPAYSTALRIHNDHFERITRECRGIRILQNMGDGYFAEAESVTEAVRFALLFQAAMRTGPWAEIQFTARIGIHAGEVATLITEGGSGIVAPAADFAARVMSLAVGGQILLTRFPFDEARHFLREHPVVVDRDKPPLRWLAHGPYRLKGRDEPLDIFEVGAEGLAPLTPPPDGDKARRAIRPGEEETLGWRPALGLEIPGRPGWQLTGKLGAGGFGEVWIGEHTKLRHRRAFKFCFDDERLRALKREVTLVRLLRTALGDRDDIVRFHELKLDEPPFYLESDLAPHGNLLQWAEKQGGLAAIPLAQRIGLVAHTATALAAAHSIGVLHKDIKPTNILIFDAPDGMVRPRLVDFGIGTLADPTVLGHHGITAAGFTSTTIKHSTGTPTYSPPEYLAGKPYTIQGDIYGLGVLLYQLITSKSLDPLAVGWERDIADPLLREDIAACVDGDPARRLPSAADLADRLLSLDQRRTAMAEQERLSRESAARAEAEAREAIERERRKEVELHNLKLRALLSESARSDRLSAEDNLRRGRQPAAFAYLARACEYDPLSMLAAEKAIAALNSWHYPVPAEILTGHEGRVLSAQFSPDNTRIITASLDKTARVWDAVTGKVLAILAGHVGGVFSAEFSPDCKRIVTASDDKTVRVWDAITFKVLVTLAAPEGVYYARFSPDGARIFTFFQVWDVNTGKILVTFADTFADFLMGKRVYPMFSPDFKRMVNASFGEQMRVWDTATGKMLVTFSEDENTLTFAGNPQFSPDGNRIVISSGDAQVWDAVSGKSLASLTGHEDVVHNAYFSPDGTRIVTASKDKTARVWDAATGSVLNTLTGHEKAVYSAQFSPGGKRIVTTSEDKTSRLWDEYTGMTLAIFSAGSDQEISGIQFSPDGKRLIDSSGGKTLRMWDADTEKMLLTLGAGYVTGDAQFSPDGKRVVTTSRDRIVRVWDVATGKILTQLENVVLRPRFSPEGKRFAGVSEDNTVWVLDAASWENLTTLVGHEGIIQSVQFSPDGKWIVTASDDKTARVWDAITGKALAVIVGHEHEVKSAQFNPDGKWIVTASWDKTARLWDATTGKILATLVGHEQAVGGAQFSPDGSRVATVSEDKTVRVWDATSGENLATLVGHEGFIPSAQFSPDGKWIVTASHDGTARVWDTTTGKTLAILGGYEGTIWDAEFSPDGTRIVTAGGYTVLWDAATGKALATLAGPEYSFARAEFSPDGTRIMAQGGYGGVALVWTLLPPSAGSPPEWFPDFLRYMAQMRLNSDGELEQIKASDWLVLRERLRGVLRVSTGPDTPYVCILRKHVQT